MKYFIYCLLCLYSTTALAQFATYQPLEEIRSLQASPAQTVAGYIPTSHGWVKVGLQVKSGEYSIQVVAYKPNANSQYQFAGQTNNWIRCNSAASSVSAYRDGQFAADNFDFKAHIQGLGTVYF